MPQTYYERYSVQALPIKSEIRKYLVDHKLSIFPRRDALEGEDIYTIFENDDGESIDRGTFRITDECKIKSAMSLGEVIDRFKNGNLITDDYIKDNIYWINEVIKTTMESLVSAYNGALVNTLDFAEGVSLTKKCIQFPTWETDPVKIANYIVGGVASDVRDHPLFYDFSHLPMLQMSPDKSMVIATIFYTAKPIQAKC